MVGWLRFGTGLHESLGDWLVKRLGGRMSERLDERKSESWVG